MHNRFDRVHRLKSRLAKDPDIRADGLLSGLVTLGVLAGPFAEMGQRSAWLIAEPAKRRKLQGRLLEEHPHDASARLSRQCRVDVDITRLGTAIAGLQLYVTQNTSVLEDQIVPAIVHLRA